MKVCIEFILNSKYFMLLSLCVRVCVCVNLQQNLKRLLYLQFIEVMQRTGSMVCDCSI